MSVDIVAFLRARLDDDEQAARASEPRPWLASPTARPGSWVYVESGGDPLAVHEVAQVRVAANAVHMARHDPARVLRDVEAKRRIVDWCVEVIGDRNLSDLSEFGSLRDDPNALAVTLAVETLRLLAAPYADHPDYDPAWGTP